MGVVLKVAENGRLNLPSQMRRLVGLEQGGPVSIWVEDGEIRIRAVRDVMGDLQGEALRLFSDSGDSVERFIDDRHAAARDENDPS